jgi:hypothetical protein
MPRPKPPPTRQSLEDVERAKRLEQTVQVLAQPHRRGDDSDMVCALGTFVRLQECGRRCFDAGKLYTLLVAKWRRAKGIPQPDRIDEEGSHGGGELDEDTVEDWGKRIKDCENAMKCSGVAGFRAANNLILNDFPPPVSLYGPVKRALTQLAIYLGLYA